MIRTTRRAHRALYALPLALLLALLLAPSSPAAAPAYDSRPGACTGDEGVTLIVDKHPTNSPPIGAGPVFMHCVFGAPDSSYEVLERSGVSFTFQDFGFGPFVTGIDGMGDADFPACDWTNYTVVPCAGGWVFFEVQNGAWVDSQIGAGAHAPKAGEVVGWRYHNDNRPDRWPPAVPRVSPLAVTISPAPAPAPVAGTDVAISFTVHDVDTDVRCRIDNHSWSPCTSDDAHTFANVTAGTHMLSVRSVDFWNNATITKRSFEVVPSAAAISGVSHALTGPWSATVSATVAAGGGAQQVHVEYGVGTDHAATVRSAPKSAPASASTPVTFALNGLTSNTTFSYRVVTTGAAGTVTSPWATLTTPWRAATLTVARSRALVHRKARVTLTINRLAPGEAFTVHLRGTKLASGTATGDGTARVRVRIPATSRAGRAKLVVRGAQADRIGSTRVTVTTPRKLTVRTSRARVTAGGRVRVTATRLIAGERVTVRYRGKVVARGVAAKGGRFVRTIKVGSRAGRAAIKVTGQHASRAGSKTIRVSARRR